MAQSPARSGRLKPIHIALMFGTEGFTRSLLIAVLPVQALDVLGDAQKWSTLIFAVSVLGVFFNFALPWLVYRLGRPRLFTIGAAAIFVSQGLLYTSTLPGLALGLFLQMVVATASVEIALNLYVMQIVRRQDMGRFEPLRVFCQGVVWVVGPVLGPYLKTRYDIGVPFAIAAGIAVVLYVFFRIVRPPEEGGSVVGKRPPLPSAYLRRFFAQPRLRLAWGLALARNCLWNVLFYYAPVYAVTSGLGEIMGGAIISIGTASLFLIPLWGWIAQRHGYRRMLTGAYLAAGIFNVAMLWFGEYPMLGAGLLALSGFAGSFIDACGNTHFLRAVHAHERAQMAAVFTTHRPLAQFGPPGIFSVVLKAFDLPAVFFTLGLGLLAGAYYTRYLPRRF